MVSCNCDGCQAGGPHELATYQWRASILRSPKRLMISALLALVGTCLFLPPACSHTIYVTTAGKTTNDGQSWQTSKYPLQSAIDAAQSGDEIWVAKGTYYERLTLKDGVAVYGGFAGKEGALSERDFSANVTVLSASWKGSAVRIADCPSASTRIDGFTIKNGSGTLINNWTRGGGVCCTNSSPTIANNQIINNLDEYGQYGGGIYCSGGSPTISGNTISNNESYYGGGICCDCSSATISENTLTGNTRTAIYCTGNAQPLIVHNKIDNNCNDNHSGGGIWCDRCSPTITGNTITCNSGSFGGGICSIGGSPTVTSNVIANNVAEGYYRHGGAIYCGSGGAPVICNNTIVSNVATGDGGGIFIDGSSAEVTNNIIAFNSSGITKRSGSASMSHNCVYGNTTSDYTGLSAGAGDILSDPKLASVAYGNFHIQTDSPCVDSGQYDSRLVSSQDVDGEARVNPGTAKMDIGADESAGNTWVIAPRVVRVSNDGNDANDGSSWSAAKQHIGKAISAISGVGGAIWVKKGAYVENISIPAYVYLYGGFAGVESTLEERDWRMNLTAIEGQQQGPVTAFYVPGYLNNRIDGFTIRKGKPNPSDNATGIWCEYGSPVVCNNTITGNGNVNWAGGIVCLDCSPVIVNNAICDNRGSGINSHYSSPMIANNVISGNYAWWRAGGIQVTSGGIYGGNGPAAIVNNTIVCNSTSQRVGGISLTGETITGFPVANNIIAFNLSGIYSSGLPNLKNNCVYGNGVFDYEGVSRGAGDISLDPLLVNPVYGDVHIQPGSPCIGAGRLESVKPDWVDMDGEPRLTGDRIDIGADQSDGTSRTVIAQIVRVSPTGDDANDGSSWQMAKRTLQAAINGVGVQGGEIWAKAGIYNERITISSRVFLYGGFVGDETARMQRDWNTNQTIIDGQQNGRPVSFTAGGYLTSSINGFALRNGKANGGGGISCYRCSPAIENNKITGNTSVDSSGNGVGGGIYVADCSPWIANNVISGNTAGANGGGIACSNTITTLCNNTIVKNTAPKGGGALYGGSDGSPSLVNCILAFNSSAVMNTASMPVVNNNCFFENGTSGSNGIGNACVTKDPLFANLDGGDCHLLRSSPCIGAGWSQVRNLPQLDCDAQGRVYGTAVDIGADEWWPSLNASRNLEDGALIDVSGAAVTAVFPNAFYIESDNRAFGIRVEMEGYDLCTGMRTGVTGTMATNEHGERYINATKAPQLPGRSYVTPMGMSTRSLGGANLAYVQNTGAGQLGIAGGIGLNNIGLLVKVWGALKRTADGCFLDDGSGRLVKLILPEGVAVDPEWNFLSVTGISSCERTGNEVHSVLRVCGLADILPVGCVR